MSPLIRMIAAWTALATVLLVTLAWAEANGFVSQSVTNLWAKAIVLIDGPPGFRATDAFYPPVPYVLALIIQGATGGTSVPIPSLLSAGLGAFLVLIWFFNLRDKGNLGTLAAILVTALLTLNPFFLRAVSDGPETVLLLIGSWIYARGLVNLRLSGNAPDMMKVAVGLLIVSLSHSYGLLICAGAMPCIIVAARPSMLVASSWGYLFSMFFPVLTAVASLLFISAIFNSSLIPLIVGRDMDAVGGNHGVVLAGITPVAFVAVFRTVKSPRHFMPLLAAMGTVFGAYVLNSFYHIESDPFIAIAPMLSVIAVAMRFWPPVTMRTANMIALPALSLLLCLISFRENKGNETARWYTAMTRQNSGAVSPTREIAGFLVAKDNIMVDVERNPEIVTALGTVANLLLAGSPAYDTALQGGRITADYIVTQNGDDDSVTSDRVLRGFPLLKSDKLNNYGQVFEDDNWRVYQKFGQ
ncbi:hypothetical protein [Puniceibacterium sp. IMCC21224]|uniref:hypothetical protein n=1 Tax=Puniceibacterium sp. IMCC21224 TaxID=1618204 RepID=UPI00064DC23E|nr:hypothetical protein [Puniceibacterium sp. IMCC21224]KMK64954.1 hypothetical protein IMCC21224_12199 [Puniceibacterium sp. IMCC21224]